MFAVIKTGGKQYRVSPDDVLTIERIQGETGTIVTFDDVPMLGDGDDVTVGAPLVDGAAVAAELVEQARGPKVIIFKKKRRQKYRRKKGHRQDLSVLRVTEILTAGAKPKVKATGAPLRAPYTPSDETVTPAQVEARAAEVDDAVPTPAEAAADKSLDKVAADKAPATDDLPVLFDAPEGAADDLKKISGVGKVIEGKLHALGIKTYDQIANFSDEDIARVDAALAFKGRIARENWIDQAKTLAAGGEEE